MNNKLLILFSFLVLGSLSARIIETARFQDIVEHVDENTLVLLDIDDTLLLPVQTLGSDVWFLDRRNQLEKAGLTKEEAHNRALQDWEAIRKITQVRIVEPGSDQVVKELQKKTKVMALTTQAHRLAMTTELQLKALNFDLTLNPPHHEDYYYMNPDGCLYTRGILFTTATPKGEAIFKLLDKIDYHPKKIVFINDKESHLKDLEKTAHERKVEFIGLRYSIGDERVAKYDSRLADVQWKHSTFHRILSDQEAELLISTTITSMGSSD